MLQKFNIWSPAYFGTSIPQPSSQPYDLRYQDLIVTTYENDTECSKANPSTANQISPISFQMEKVVGGIDIDYPGFLTCTCCCRYRGWVILSNGERWRFDEIKRIDKTHYEFQAIQNDGKNPESLNKYPKALVWEFYSDWESWFGEARTELPFTPFTMGQDTRLCRIIPKQHLKHYLDTSLFTPVVAIMNREDLVFVDGLEGAAGIETANLRELILMTGLAIAKFERPKLEN